MDFPARAYPWGLQKYWLPSIPARAWTQPLERTACLHSSPLERKLPRSSGNHVCRKCWELDFSARASLHPLERTTKIWESQVEFLSSIPTFNQQIMHVVAQISHISILTRYKHQNTLLWSSISRIKHLHVSNWHQTQFYHTYSCIQSSHLQLFRHACPFDFIFTSNNVISAHSHKI